MVVVRSPITATNLEGFHIIIYYIIVIFIKYHFAIVVIRRPITATHLEGTSVEFYNNIASHTNDNLTKNKFQCFEQMHEP